MVRIALVLPVLIACGPTVTAPATPHVECGSCGRAIATFTPVVVSSSWNAICEEDRPGLYAIGPVEPSYTSCKPVTYSATLRCDGDACVSDRTDDQAGFIVRATRPGPLAMHVAMTKHDGKTHVVDLPPVTAYTPTGVTVVCAIPAESPHPIVEVHLVSGDVVLEDDPTMQVTLRSGEPCPGWGLSFHAMNQDGPLAQRISEHARVFRCADAVDHLDLDVKAAGTTFATEASCERLPAETAAR
jgi:hypothetical protein